MNVSTRSVTVMVLLVAVPNSEVRVVMSRYGYNGSGVVTVGGGGPFGTGIKGANSQGRRISPCVSARAASRR